MPYLETGVNAPEPSVDGQLTDAVCQKLDANRFIIDGKNIELPVKVNAASMLMLMFVVDARKVAELIAGSGYQPLTIWPGKALLQLLAVDYRENDLGDYNEGAIIFPVKTPKQTLLPMIGGMLALMRGTACNYVYRMPVNQAFTTHAGRYIWGFPKWPTDVQVAFSEKQASGIFNDNNALVYEITAATGGNFSFTDQTSPSVTVRNGKACKTYGISSASGVTFRLGGKLPNIGNDHPLAKQLRELGLPKKPICSVSAKQLKMRFGAGEFVNIGEKFTT